MLANLENIYYNTAVFNVSLFKCKDIDQVWLGIYLVGLVQEKSSKKNDLQM